MYGQNYQQNNGYGYQPQQNYGQYPQQGYPQQQSARPAVHMSAAQMLDQIDQQNSKSAHFENPGDHVTGTIENITANQVRDFKTKEPNFWNDGSPQLQILVTINTGITDPNVEDDDGRRTVYIKGWGVQRRAWQQALRNAGVKKTSEIKPGDRFSATFTGYGERGNAPQPPKLFEYVIERQNPVDAVMGQPAPNTPQQGVYPQNVVQTYSQYPPQSPMPQGVTLNTHTPQPTMSQAPHVDEQEILRLHAVGKSVPEIQTLTGFLAADIQRVLANATPHGGSEQEPEF